MIEISAADNLLRTPKIKKIPEINSANAIGIYISIGIPIFVKKFENPGLNLDIPCAIKITPSADLKPMNVTSFKIFSLISASVNMFL